MQVEQLFVEKLIDIKETLADNPSEYDLLKVSGLLRPILLEKLLDDASAAASLDVKFRVVKPEPPPIPPEVQSYPDSLPPTASRPVMGFSYRGDLLTGKPQFPGDVVLELGRKDFLNHELITWMDNHYTVENVLRVAANSLGGIHYGEKNWHPRSEELRQYMEGATWFGRSMPRRRQQFRSATHTTSRSSRGCVIFFGPSFWRMFVTACSGLLPIACEWARTPTISGETRSPMGAPTRGSIPLCSKTA